MTDDSVQIASRWKGNLIVFSAGCLLTLMLLEILLPFFVQMEKVTLIYDSLLGFRGRPNIRTDFYRELNGSSRVVQTNRFGFHDANRKLEKAPNTHRVVFLGDSFVEGYQVEISENFCFRIGETVGSDGEGGTDRVEVINQGLHGYGLGSYYLYVKNRLLAWRPDTLVLVLFLGNDLHDNYTPIASPAVPRFELKNGELRYTPAPAYSLRTWVRDEVMARSTLFRSLWLQVFRSNVRLMNLARSEGLLSTPNMMVDLTDRSQEMILTARKLLFEIQSFLAKNEVGLLVYVIPDPFLVQDAVHSYSEESQPNVVAYRKGKLDLEERFIALLGSMDLEYVYPKRAFVDEILAGKEIYLNGFGHFSKFGHEASVKQLDAPLRAAIRGDREPAE